MGYNYFHYLIGFAREKQNNMHKEELLHSKLTVQSLPQSGNTGDVWNIAVCAVWLKQHTVAYSHLFAWLVPHWLETATHAHMLFPGL